MTDQYIPSDESSSFLGKFLILIHFFFSRIKSCILGILYRPTIPLEYVDYLIKNGNIKNTESLRSLTSETITKQQYDALHDRHISNHTGSTFIHLTFMSGIFFLLVLYLSLTIKNAYFQRRKPVFLSQEWFSLFGVEFIVKIFLNILLVFQSFQNHVSISMLSLFILGVIILLFVHRARQQQFQWFSKKKVVLLEHQSQKSFVSEFRSQLMLTTCICILAVDFKDFMPGYFKVEEWGIGLMDTGVALFVFSSGLVSIAARLNQSTSIDNKYIISNDRDKREIQFQEDRQDNDQETQEDSLDEESTLNVSLQESEKSNQKIDENNSNNNQFIETIRNRKSTKNGTHSDNMNTSSPNNKNINDISVPLDESLPLRKIFIKIFKHSAPLFALGLVRFVTLWAADYQVHAHVSEYGIHWNFFFTLAVISVYVNILDIFLKNSNAIHYLVFAIGTAFLQQALLLLGMEDYIFNAPRVNFISANKEGICSILGYLSIHYFSVAVGRLIFSSYAASKLAACEHTKTHLLFSQRWKFISKVIFGSISILWIIHIFFGDPETVGGPLIFQKLLKRVNIPSKFIKDPKILRSITVPSRRLLNLPYILWNLTQALCILGSSLFFEISIDRITRHHLLRDAINRNSLIIFLFSNIITGLTNIVFKTLLMREIVGIAYVVVYMFIVCFVALILHEKNITIRL